MGITNECNFQRRTVREQSGRIVRVVGFSKGGRRGHRRFLLVGRVRLNALAIGLHGRVA
jgi:hypothetical protein